MGAVVQGAAAGSRSGSLARAAARAAALLLAVLAACGAEPDLEATAGSPAREDREADHVPAGRPTTTGPRPTTTAPTTTTTTAPPGPALPGGRRAVVGSITDGDTFRTSAGERIRLIGIDTPEVADGECFAGEATQALTRLIPPGTEVVLVADVEATDRYGRTLAYVHRAADALFVNVELARLGVAQQLTVPPNVAHADEIGAAVRSARAAGRGLWSGCPTTTTAPPTTAPRPQAVVPPLPPPPPSPPPPPPSGSCHPSYPTVCIPPAPPDLDCPEIPHRRFQVIGEDPHGFDGDHDGIGCES